MGTTNYDKAYVKCYELVIDITKDIKDFFYPGQYSFAELDENLPVSQKLELIKKDLESMKFEKEIPSELFKYLQAYYPVEKVLSSDIKNDELSFLFYGNLQRLSDEIKNKYLPFIKTISIKKYREDNPSKRFKDEEIWESLLASDKDVEIMESRINDVIWAGIDGSKMDIADGFLMEQYKLDEIEYRRYLNGEQNEFSSISKKENDKAKLKVNFKNFDRYFGEIIGQDEAVTLIRRVLMRNIMFYNAKEVDEDKNERQRGPLATFMFYGPTGTGKTETSKIMADFIYGDENKMLLLDMNSYKDSHVSASAIKGHPEGYVDSAKGTDFTRFLEKNDRGIIVLDEFEKANPEVREIFMTMLDEGKFKDALGNIYDLSGYVFIATTNVSKVFEKKRPQIGFHDFNSVEAKREEEMAIKDQLREIFTAPIMNRFNNIVGFNKISRKAGASICENLIIKLCKKFERRSFDGIQPKIKINDMNLIVDYVLEESNFNKDGVRCIKNNINDIIGSQILEEIIDGNGDLVLSFNSQKRKVEVSKEMLVVKQKTNNI